MNGPDAAPSAEKLTASLKQTLRWPQPCCEPRSKEIAAFSNILKKSGKAFRDAFHSGTDTAALVQGRAAIIDHLLELAWRRFKLTATPGVALVAVGGYGRGELHPFSDIDLMVLLNAPADVSLEERLSEFLIFLWDIGLPVGHSVRTLDESVSAGADDVTIATNLMESRLLAGPESLYRELTERVAPPHIWPSREFFSAKLDEQDRRHHKFGDTAYRLEPNVKESPGGMRDIQTVGWVTKRHLGATSLHELVHHGFLGEDEYQTLASGQSFLWRVRYALHMLAGRREDRLLFDYQRTIAEQFGYADEDNNLAVEQFMQRYYRTVMELQRLNEMLLQLYKEAILYAGETDEPQWINRRFRARKGFLEVTNENIFRRYPSALLELFLVMQQHPELKGVRASTIRLVREHCYLIDDNFRDHIANRSLFMEILCQPSGITHELRRMNRYGVLAAYWPSFARVAGRMQYDLFHTYTVDEHTLVVLRNVRRLSVPEFAHELPFCSELFWQIPKPELLYLAALFHDIGKGRGGDHSDIGAREAEVFCLQHGLSEYDARLVAWLVRHHLSMSLTAQRRDISDPAIINSFAEKAGNLARLNYLYLLTVSDIRATNPNLWNSWKDALLMELYVAARRVLQRGLDNPLARDELIGEVKQASLQLLQARGLDLDACRELWREFDEQYFLRHSDDEIAWHTQAIVQSDLRQRPLVLVRQLTARGSTEIFIYAQSHPQLFAYITSALARLGLDVLDARITTTSAGYTLDTFMVLGDAGKPIAEQFRIDEISATLANLLQEPEHEPLETSWRVSRKLRHFDVPTRITFDTTANRRYTVLELITADRPGLLSSIGKAFTDSGVLVHNARITTIGEQAEDMFIVTDLKNQPIIDEWHLALIRARLLTRLGKPAVREVMPQPDDDTLMRQIAGAVPDDGESGSHS
ncbi:MAG: [protein-PII] uridylyltransferase [Gammaproteobacteria bacterium]|nr:[protein-PII] uridylyltransferase [Gammaproteobacteria bacterium]